MTRKWVGTAAVFVPIAHLAAIRSAESDGKTDRDRLSTAARREIQAVEIEIDRIEAESIDKVDSATLDAFSKSRS